jgi:phosphoglycolate phosphatase-like HAD superfamily hydrolase
VPPSPPLAIDLDAVLGDTRGLWSAWLEHAGSTLGLDRELLPADRAVAAVELDASAGNWRVLLQRFAEERAPVYLRPDAEVSAALRRLADRGTRLGAYSDGPAELARVALLQLGAARRIDVVETGVGALERLLAALGEGAALVRSREELVLAAA